MPSGPARTINPEPDEIIRNEAKHPSTANGGFVKKPELLDLFGLSGDPSDHARLDDLFLRLESDSPVPPRGTSILIEKGESNCRRKSLPAPVCAGDRPDRPEPARRWTSRRFHAHGILRNC
jgi:hypothetical protein